MERPTMTLKHCRIVAVTLALACGSETTGPVAGSITISPDAGLLAAIGETLRLAVTVRDVDGNELDAAVSWTTSASSVATVDPEGLVVARGNGSAVIRAESAQRGYPAPVSGGQTYTMVTAGMLHACALTVAGDAYCWGSNGGALGNGTTTGSTVPVAVAGGLRFTSLGAGGGMTCGISTADILYCWGTNRDGELGDGTLVNRTVPTRVLLIGCETFSVPMSPAELPRPAFSEGCYGTIEECNQIGQAIGDLQNHESTACQSLGDAAAARFDDPHLNYNTMQFSVDKSFIVSPDSDQHGGAPTYTGHSYASNSGNLAGNIAANEAAAAGIDPQLAYNVCSS